MLQGKDAQTARDFFAEARKGQIDAPVLAASEGNLYRVSLRERVDPQLAQRIARFLRSRARA